MDKLNNAQIKCMGRVDIMDYEIVDAAQKIWKGLVVFDAKNSGEDHIVYFSRRYDVVTNDIDRMLEEYEIKNTSIIGVKFLLIPREKLLFAYEPPSSILRPQIHLSKKGM